jgi:hypothetical protein
MKRYHRNPETLTVLQVQQRFTSDFFEGRTKGLSQIQATLYAAQKNGVLVAGHTSDAPVSAPAAPRAVAPAPAPRAVASAPAPVRETGDKGGEWAVIDRKKRYASAAMSYAAAKKHAAELLDDLVPSWEIHDRGLDIQDEEDFGDMEQRHVYDAAQERAAEEWHEEADRMRAEAKIEVVPASEARAFKQEMLGQSSRSGGAAPSYGEPWSGYSGHGRGGFGSAGGWGPGGGRGGWGGG